MLQLDNERKKTSLYILRKRYFIGNKVAIKCHCHLNTYKNTHNDMDFDHIFSAFVNQDLA